jgi:hypothetical protein
MLKTFYFGKLDVAGDTEAVDTVNRSGTLSWGVMGVNCCCAGPLGAYIPFLLAYPTPNLTNSPPGGRFWWTQFPMGYKGYELL